MHAMNVKTKYYRLLKSGVKTIELRLYDEKRQKIKVGDTVLFSDSSDETDHFSAMVVALHRADSFSSLCEQIDPAAAGFSSSRELLEVLGEFYTSAAQKKYGVVGIEIKRM